MFSSIETIRAGILARMIDQAPDKKLGRTQVMKLFYFLQELKGADLGYDFRLFTYGPFDSEVLSDLSTARIWDVVIEKTVVYTRGYGFEITLGPKADTYIDFIEDNDPKLATRVDEIVKEFGHLGAAELELRSTIIFVDREFASQDRNIAVDDIVERVRHIKPHFDAEIIRERVSGFEEKDYLKSPNAHKHATVQS